VLKAANVQKHTSESMAKWLYATSQEKTPCSSPYLQLHSMFELSSTWHHGVENEAFSVQLPTSSQGSWGELSTYVACKL
jgi:hypothetical protein